MGRVLVTGAGGVLGTAVTTLLAKNDRDFVALRTRAECDLEDFSRTYDFFREVDPEVVVHLAGAIYGVGGNLAFPADIFRRNTLINANAIEAARRLHVKKFVGMGTTAMYADGLQAPMRESDVMTAQPHSSERFYAYAKRGMLMHLEACKLQYGMEYAVLLATNLYGPNDRFDETHGHVIPSLISKFVASAETGSRVCVWGDGSPTRDFLYSEDAAEGILKVLDRGTGVYNLASGVSVSIAELVSTIHKLVPEAQFEWDTSKPLGQLVRSYDIERIRSIGFTTKFSLYDGLASTIEWFRQNQSILRRGEN